MPFPCLLLSLLALSCLCVPARAQVPEVGTHHVDAEAMAADYAMMANPGSAARMSDSDASCEQLYAESGYLETRIAALPSPADPMEAAARLQEDMFEAQRKAMAGARAKGLASSLLGMVPGVGGIAGSLASGAMSGGGGMQAMGEASRKAMEEMQRNNQAMMAVAQLQMRNGHVTDLFLSRNCKVSGLDRGQVDGARASLEASEGRDAALPPASKTTLKSSSETASGAGAGDAGAPVDAGP